MRIAVIINPVSGTRHGAHVGRARAELAAAHLARLGHEAEVRVTERVGHARELAAGAVARGAEIVCAWGGDGTVNEVGSALVHGPVPLGIVPSGSGNGLARELGLPLDGARALDAMLAAPARRMDAGEVAGRVFFNVAGVGLDATIAHRFNDGVGFERGVAGYVWLTALAIARYRAPACRVRWPEGECHVRPLLVAVANARQYGYGARIAPHARLDDGALDIVVVADRPLWRIVPRLPALFTGRIGLVPGVRTIRTARAEITSDQLLPCHVDGELVPPTATVTVRTLAGVLLVQAPNEATF